MALALLSFISGNKTRLYLPSMKQIKETLSATVSLRHDQGWHDIYIYNPLAQFLKLLDFAIWA